MTFSHQHCILQLSRKAEQQNTLKITVPFKYRCSSQKEIIIVTTIIIIVILIN